MKIMNRKYSIWDYIKIPFLVSPVMVIIRVLFDRIIYALIPSLQVLVTARFIDTCIGILEGRYERVEIAIPIVMLLVLTSYGYLMLLTGLAQEKLKIRLAQTFSVEVMQKRAVLEYWHIENNETWDLVERVGRDSSERIDNGFESLTRIGEIFIRVGAVLLVLAMQVWWAALVIMAFSVPLFMLAIKSGKANYVASAEATKHMRRADYYQEVLIGRDNVEERTLFGYSDELSRRYKDQFLAAYKIVFKAQKNRFAKMSAAGVITVVISIGVAGVLLVPLNSGAISIGMFMGLVSAVLGLVPVLVTDLTHVTSELASGREYMRDLSAFSKLTETPDAIDLPIASISLLNHIEFRGVSFTYPGTDSFILKDISFKLHAGKHYAFVGSNGAGKTTITKLLAGLYDNYTGDILVDGKNLRDFSQAEMKAMFSVVYQDFAKYQVPIIDSIGIGDMNSMNDSSLQQCNVVDAAVALGLDKVVAKLPGGLNTSLGRIRENSVDLSGGEWQRVALARSLISCAPVSILDEPTAALDPVAESDLYKLLGSISKGKLTIFITHRLGAARLSDEIIVIANGCVAEQGTHAELMSNNGIYTEMFEAQKGWYA